MRLISSRLTLFSKRVFPIFWFGFLAFFISNMAPHLRLPGELGFLAIPLAMMGFGFLMMRKFAWDLADEVYDGGDFLLFKRGAVEARIPFKEMVNVSVSLHQNPRRVTIRLATPCEFGHEIAFSPAAPFTLNPFAKNPIAEELILRVDAARRH